MNVTLAYASSLNGKITAGDDSQVHSWSSPEDWQHFVTLRDSCDVIILDRKTFEVVRPPAQPGKLRIVFTSTPERFSADWVAGQLEFVDIPPAELIEQLKAQGHQKVLLAGGATLSSAFLSAQLIDDMYVSIEPLLFGPGRPMFEESIPSMKLKLQSIEQLNEQGTLLVHYSVIKTI